MEKGNGNSGIDEIKQKALKITEALYRTTDMMLDGEPLKWSLRNTAVDILNIISGLNSGGQLRDIEKLNSLVSNLFLKLELASSGTFISKMNFEVLQREYSMLGDRARKYENQPILLEAPSEIRTSPQYRTQESITDTILDNNILDRTEMSKKEEEKEILEIVSEDKKIEPDPNRKAVIISALESKGHSSISDIARLFNGTIGEKTVQRELNALVEVGAIKKEGEKRWRRYFL